MLTLSKSDYATPLQMFYALIQPERIIHLGSRRRFEESIVAHLSPKTTALLDAERENPLAQRSAKPVAAGEIVQGVCSADGCEQDYYVSSHPLASGSIHPERLQGLWQNAACLSQEIRPTISIKSFLGRWDKASKWISFDMLGAAEILAGLTRIPQDIKAISALVTVTESDVQEGAVYSEEYLSKMLASEGFAPAAKILNRHPKLISVVYFRSLSDARRTCHDARNDSENRKARDMAEQKLRLAESNLNDLRMQYAMLAEENQRQTEQLSNIAQHLRFAAAQSDLPTKDS